MFFSYDPQLVLNQDVVPLNTSEWSIAKPSETVCEEPVDLTESTEDLFEPPPTDLITVSAEHYLEQGLQQIESAAEGSRHNTYCRVAYSCGVFASSDLLAREDSGTAYKCGKKSATRRSSRRRANSSTMLLRR